MGIGGFSEVESENDVEDDGVVWVSGCGVMGLFMGRVMFCVGYFFFLIVMICCWFCNDIGMVVGRRVVV